LGDAVNSWTRESRRAHREGAEARKEQLGCVVLVGPTELLILTPADNSLPVGRVLNVLDLEAHLRIRTHGANFQPVGGMGVDRLSVVGIRDGHNVDAAVGATANAPDIGAQKESLNLVPIQFSQHAWPLGSTKQAAYPTTSTANRKQPARMQRSPCARTHLLHVDALSSVRPRLGETDFPARK